MGMIGPSDGRGGAVRAALPESARRRLVLLLCASVALMMSGYGIVIPIFAKRVSEIHAGIGLLGLMAMAFAAGQVVAAPVMGVLADRCGRRPVILSSLCGFTVAEAAFLFAEANTTLVLIQFANGVVTAGLLPGSMGVIGDLFSANERARWTGIVMSSYAAGFILGPAVGGLICDRWGSRAPFLLSAMMGLLSLVFAVRLLPETRTRQGRAMRVRASRNEQRRTKRNHWLPAPVWCFVSMLLLDFVIVFTFASVEPVLMLYAYEKLHLAAAQLGALVGGYGLSMAAAQVLLGGSSDRLGRMPVIVVGFVLNAVFYFGVILFSRFWVIVLVAAVAGIGNGLVTPALGAAYLDVAQQDARGRLMGMKEAAGAAGSFGGPLLVALMGQRAHPYDVFLVAAFMTLAAAVLAGLALYRLPRRHADSVVEVDEYAALGISPSGNG